MRDCLRLIKKSSETEELAYNSSNNNDVYLVPAFTGLGAPYWNPEARGTIFGLTRATTKEDLVKATLQSIAYQVRDIIDTMKIDANIEIPLLKVDGGAAHNNYLLQFQSDILGVKIARAENLETTALGAAFFAGLATGYWKNLEEIKNLNSAGKLFVPAMKVNEREKLYKGWERAVRATEFFAKDE